jgi:CBS-domain-containing membrane protein
VVDTLGALVGIVSEGDLMRRAETDTDAQHGWWLRLLSGQDTLAADYVRAHARKVGDVMTTNVITANRDASLRDIASLMERKRIKRVPIVEGGQVIGIVSRANLLQAFASLYVPAAAPAGADDEGIREKVLSRLRAESWSSPNSINVIVQQGVVELWGAVHSETEHKAVRIAAETTPGVRTVRDNLVVGLVQSGI